MSIVTHTRCSKSKKIRTNNPQPDTTPFNITYGTGSVQGTLATDTLHMGPLSSSLTFGLASSVSSEFRSYPMDGILGLGRGSSSTTSLLSIFPNKLFALHLSRAADGNDGELNVGEVNTARYSGDITYMSCVESSSEFWEIPLDAASVDGKSVALGGKRTAIVDSGTSFVLLPPDDALALHSGIQGFQQDGEAFLVPCDSKAGIQFSFGGRAFDVSSEDWMGAEVKGGLCRSNIIGRQTFGEGQWLVGDVFLRNVYAVFDGAAGRVGFGVKSKDGSSSSSASSTGGVSGASATVMATGTSGPGSSAMPTSTSAGGSAEPTAAAENQPQGQAGGAARTTSGLVWTLAAGVISLLI